MLRIIDGDTRSLFSIKTENGKKKYAISYSFHLDTGDITHKAGAKIQHAAEKGYSEVSQFVRRKYRAMKVKKAWNNMRRALLK